MDGALFNQNTAHFSISIYNAIGLLAVIMFASALCFWIIPAVNGKWEAMSIALWMYGWYYGYYLFTKRYTKWWKDIGE